MKLFPILRDAWYFYSRNLPAIAMLCLPLIVLESGAKLAVEHWLGKGVLPAQELLTGLVFYPLYVGALILYLDARSRGHEPSVREVLARTLPLWPALALLAAVGTLLIILGASLFVLPALWVMVKIAFAEYLLVLRGMTPLQALKESFQLTRGHFLLILGCLLAVLLPVWLAEAWIASLFMSPEQTPNPLAMMILDSLFGMLQLLATVALFRCFMLCSASAVAQDRQD